MGQAAHLRNYVNLPDVEVVALAELRPNLGRLVGDRYGIKRVYNTAQELLRQEEIDGIVAVQIFTYHGSILPPLYDKGVPLFTEKPLAGSIEVGKKLLSKLSESKSWHMVGYHKRSDPATIYAKAEIDRLRQTGELGKLKYVRILMPAGDWIASGFNDLIVTNESYPSIASDPAPADMSESAYNEYFNFVNYYIHQINLMRHLLGESYKVTYAEQSGVLLAVESSSGIPGTIEMSPYTTSIDWQESALIAFEHGWIKLNLPAPVAYNRPGSVEVFRDSGNGVTPTTTVPTLPWVHAMRQQAINFVAAIRGESKPPCDAIEALEDLVIAKQYQTLKGNLHAS
jgi:predicted dehydrogenase